MTVLTGSTGTHACAVLAPPHRQRWCQWNRGRVRFACSACAVFSLALDLAHIREKFRSRFHLQPIFYDCKSGPN